jgi:hypothetical protein
MQRINVIRNRCSSKCNNTKATLKNLNETQELTHDSRLCDASDHAVEMVSNVFWGLQGLASAAANRAKETKQNLGKDDANGDQMRAERKHASHL